MFSILIFTLDSSAIILVLSMYDVYIIVNNGKEPYSKCPFSNHQSRQRIQIHGYHIYVDAVIRDKIFNMQINEFFS